MNTMLAATVALGFAFACFVLYRLLRCAHAWEFVDKTEFPSRLEEAQKHGVPPYAFWNTQLERMAIKRVVIVLRCPKCGSTKIFKQTSS